MRADWQRQHFEAPTCSLEVWARRSPLSEWTEVPVVNQLRFRLQVSHQVIKGNLPQLENLIAAVTPYVDRLLAEHSLPSFSHTLAIPNLPTIEVSTLELCDLSANLDRLGQAIAILPCLELEVRRLTPAWLKLIAAMVAAVGVSFGTIRLLSPQPSLQVASERGRQERGKQERGKLNERSPEKTAIAPSAKQAAPGVSPRIAIPPTAIAVSPSAVYPSAVFRSKDKTKVALDAPESSLEAKNAPIGTAIAPERDGTTNANAIRVVPESAPQPAPQPAAPPAPVASEPPHEFRQEALQDRARNEGGDASPAQTPASGARLLGDRRVRVASLDLLSLRILGERYGCVTPSPNDRAIGRAEFATALSACLDKINESIAANGADKIARDDLEQIQRLQRNFAADLASLKGRVDALESRTGTRLSGEAIVTTAGASRTVQLLEITPSLPESATAVLRDRIQAMQLATSVPSRVAIVVTAREGRVVEVTFDEPQTGLGPIARVLREWQPPASFSGRLRIILEFK